MAARGSRPTEFFGWTDVVTREYVITWKLNNISSDKIISSPEFIIGDIYVTALRMAFYPTSHTLTVVMARNKPTENTVKLVLSIAGPDSTLRMTQEEVLADDEHSKDFFYDTNQLQKPDILLPDGGIRFKCQMSITGEILTSGPNASNVEDVDDSEKLSNDYYHLWINEKHTDVILQVDNEQLMVHKCILAARSSVFSAMFDNEMLESKQNIVLISDARPYIMREMCRYMYSGKVEDHCLDTTYELYFAADKYGLTGLKKQCSRRLNASMKPEDVARILCLADLCHDEDLKTGTINYFSSHFRQVVETAEWHEFMKERGTLASEALQSFAKHLPDQRTW